VEILNRQEMEDRVIDLYYNQKKTYREIEKLVRKSPRDIRNILNKVEPSEHSMMVSSRAYKLFSEHKSPIEVAIALNIRQPEAVQFYKEYFNLSQLHDLYRIYEEIKDDLYSFLEFYRLTKAARMGPSQVISLLKIANNDLASVQRRFEQLSRDVISLELEKQNSARICQELSDKIASSRKREDYVRSCCQIEISRMDQLYKKERSLEGLVQYFEDNNETYLTIRNTVEEKVLGTLSNGKMTLKLALLSLVESIRNNPGKYSSLLYHNVSSSTTDYSSQYYESYMYKQKQYTSYNNDGEGSGAMLIEEAEKLYNKLAKELPDEIINDYASSIASSSLPLLPSSDEEQGKTPVYSKHNQTETKENLTSVRLENNDTIKRNE
jgi:hypothetical protein